MQGKHANALIHFAATVRREWLREQIAGLVTWRPLQDPDDGCTAVIGMAARLPDILHANLRCLYNSRWPTLKRVIVTLDTTEALSPRHINQAALSQAYPEWDITVLHYSRRQSEAAERLKLPYLYSWMSWCIALSQVTTRHVLIHDYDALVVGPALANRYRRFVSDGAAIQGIKWYESNGLQAEDRLATTFEAFVDTAWLRAHKPIRLFNKMFLKGSRSVDYDTTLAVQDYSLSPLQRTIEPMNEADLVHPSQMIHQYTMFRRHPGKPLPCFSMPMLPFFAYLGGKQDAMQQATARLNESLVTHVDLVGDETIMNLSQLSLQQVNWALKQMVQAAQSLGIAPRKDLYLYGRALYDKLDVPATEQWTSDFSSEQLHWINQARPPAGVHHQALRQPG
ncbi:MAG: hypothetical protein ABI574_02820 [Burkholderiales bacterium]